MTNAALRGKPDAENPHVAPAPCYGGTGRFDEGEVAPTKPRRGSQLYKSPIVAAVAIASCGFAFGASVAIDATRPGAVLPNSSQVLTFWNGVMKGDRSPVAWPEELRKDYPIGFARYAELMACTGGNKSRDLFKNPDDRTVLDDYDFAPLVTACRGILGCGMRPYLKLGNIPPKFSSDYDGGEFSMNIRPPTDDLVHYRYMKACAAALKDDIANVAANDIL